MHPRKKQIVKAQGGIPAYPARFRYEPFTVFATFLADGLRVFRKGSLHSHPIDFEGHAEDWGKAIDKMIWSFDQIAHEYPDHPYTAFFEKRWKEAEANGVSLKTVSSSIRCSKRRSPPTRRRLPIPAASRKGSTSSPSTSRTSGIK